MGLILKINIVTRRLHVKHLAVEMHKRVQAPVKSVMHKIKVFLFYILNFLLVLKVY